MSDNDAKVFEFASKKRRKANSKKDDGDIVVIGTFKTGPDDEYRVRPLTDTSIAHLIHKARSGDSTVVLSAVMRFMEYALHPDDVQRFETVELDPVDGLELDEVVEVFEHVLTIVAAGDPSGGSSDSSLPSSRTGGGSRGTSRRVTSSTR